LVKELLSLSDDQYLLRLQYFYKELAGDFLAIKPRFEFNLGLNARDVIAQDRSFFMGNSAQTIHPFAGQGFNLGLRDVVVWVDLWAAKKTPTNELEARYIAMRQRDRKTTIKLIDSIVTLFRRPHYISQYGLAILLEMCELKPVKTRLSRLMMFGRR
jgi:2-octaprenyl-6-methoxyphenol hydroxylase